MVWTAFGHSQIPSYNTIKVLVQLPITCLLGDYELIGGTEKNTKIWSFTRRGPKECFRNSEKEKMYISDYLA